MAEINQPVQLGKDKPYEFGVVTLGRACENYLKTQNFVPHIYTESCKEDDKPDTAKRKMRHKPATPMITLLQGAEQLPGVVAIIRNRFSRKYQGEERFINELLQSEFKVVEVYNYEAFCDLVKWVKS